jgi:hypothetical protein
MNFYRPIHPTFQHLFYAAAVTCLLLVTTVTDAQVRKEAGGSNLITMEIKQGKQLLDWMKASLGLKPHQVDHLVKIHEQYVKSLDSVGKLQTINELDIAFHLKEERDASIEKALTSDQYRMYLVHRDERKKKSESPFTPYVR